MVGLFTVRYGVGGVLVIVGFALLVLDPSGFGVDGFALAVGAGLSIIMLNVLYRLGVEGDAEREQEEQARRYLEEHGEWPEDFRPSGIFGGGRRRPERRSAQ